MILFLIAFYYNLLLYFPDDLDVMRVIQQAAQTVPSLFLYVQGQPGTYPPAAHPYLQGMSDPSETETFTMLSFYRFSEITDPVSMAEQLQLLWKPFKALGEIRTMIFLN